ncbi:hypothetical protein P153DRAFT_394804 [Dothidotthia symphoricarpi CBS 119687]|uniref:Uncharacterized protein n=1 Tax=Dothidotthia symphoricarpi CBS 119687 TaxID=1392245 RepID=A0A6A6AHP1_9PLEO|nr:uncharacterized protein P153DRAFT_394804 [Dothidotthia symphoricarpi CBS 119687]KAF2131469.1 hypothetical protein P153DRAFT_394804 [Dothidotthia symphoricarpi CBS 119687]
MALRTTSDGSLPATNESTPASNELLLSRDKATSAISSATPAPVFGIPQSHDEPTPMLSSDASSQQELSHSGQTPAWDPSHDQDHLQSPTEVGSIEPFSAPPARSQYAAGIDNEGSADRTQHDGKFNESGPSNGEAEHGNSFRPVQGNTLDTGENAGEIQPAHNDRSKLPEMVIDRDETGEHTWQAQQPSEDLQPDLHHLITSIEAVSQALQFNTRDGGEPLVILSPPLPTYHSLTITLHRALSRLIQHFNSALESQDAQINNSQLSSRDPDADPFRTLYHQEKQLRLAAEEKFSAFKSTALKMYQPDLERKNRLLTTSLHNSQDETILLKEHIADLRTTIEHWKAEADMQRLAHEKTISARDAEATRLREEMLARGQEYGEKARDEKYWDVRVLQDRIGGLEREAEQTDVLFRAAKRERARLEEEVGRLVAREERRAGESEGWDRGWGAGLYDSSSSEDGDGEFDEGAGWCTRVPQDKTYVPRCQMPEAVAKRHVQIEEFRAKQKQIREDGKRVDVVMEKVVEWAMGAVYPQNLDSWREVKDLNSWSLWGGEDWLEREADVDDKKHVEELKRMGKVGSGKRAWVGLVLPRGTC